MPPSRNLNTYADIRNLLDSALAEGGGRLVMATPGQCINMRQRIYTYINLLRKLHIAKSGEPGYVPATPYDHLQYTIEGKVLTIEARMVTGKLMSLDGTRELAIREDTTKVADPSEFDPAPDDLMVEALALLGSADDD